MQKIVFLITCRPYRAFVILLRNTVLVAIASPGSSRPSILAPAVPMVLLVLRPPGTRAGGRALRDITPVSRQDSGTQPPRPPTLAHHHGFTIDHRTTPTGPRALTWPSSHYPRHNARADTTDCDSITSQCKRASTRRECRHRYNAHGRI